MCHVNNLSYQENESELNNLGKFSGSKPKDLITKSAEILDSDPDFITGFFLPEESGSLNIILLISTSSTLSFPKNLFGFDNHKNLYHHIQLKPDIYALFRSVPFFILVPSINSLIF